MNLVLFSCLFLVNINKLTRSCLLSEITNMIRYFSFFPFVNKAMTVKRLLRSKIQQKCRVFKVCFFSIMFLALLYSESNFILRISRLSFILYIAMRYDRLKKYMRNLYPINFSFCKTYLS